ncbi:uncharacterized protein V1516DRAFT_675066 [Lipomyces oligophaga]|uniref:uncharacterized protein n=1 Tax=Lipomyces oligophaga TaxID=45792 RepID=UPI0034CE0182
MPSATVRGPTVISPVTSDDDMESTSVVDPRDEIAADEDLLEDLPGDVDSIELIQMRIKSIPALKLDRFEKLDSLCLRENLVEDIEGLESVGPGLVELDLYDNRINKIESLGPEEGEHMWAKLENLDFSFNKIRKIRHISHLKALKNLYFVQNKISVIENLVDLDRLDNLELGGNRIRKLENLEGVPNLTQLWVGKNKITKLENLSRLQNLRILSIQSNRVTKIEGLEALGALEELYISHNGLTKLEGLDKNVNLHVLDISSNEIEHIENLSQLINLQELWASSNKFSSFDEIERELKHITTLNTVYFEGNPIEKENRLTYRNRVRLALGTGIIQIDASMVTESQTSIR